METLPNKDAKLSDAILIGAKIAKENGIRVGTGGIIMLRKYNGGAPAIDCACTAGLALIGKYGHKEIAQRFAAFKDMQTLFNRAFGGNKPVTECLIKTAKKEVKMEKTASIYRFIWYLNDNVRSLPRTIAGRLKKCEF